MACGAQPGNLSTPNPKRLGVVSRSREDENGFMNPKPKSYDPRNPKACYSHVPLTPGRDSKTYNPKTRKHGEDEKRFRTNEPKARNPKTLQP